jgi:hypothetical protein
MRVVNISVKQRALRERICDTQNRYVLSAAHTPLVVFLLS